MYDVEIKHVDEMNSDMISFTCEGFDINSGEYRFTNIVMDNFVLNYFEIRNEDIGMIKIK